MFLIGEQINCTRKPIARAAKKQDSERIQLAATRQTEAGAACLDVNGGVAGFEEAYLAWLVDVIQDATDVPLCLDSPDSKALATALPRCKKRPIINSITNERERVDVILPLVVEYETGIVALCMDEQGYPTSADDRVAMASTLIDTLTSADVSLDRIYIDPAVFPISTDVTTGQAVLQSISEILHRYPGVHVTCGLSNVSFGLPVRSLLNSTFLALAMGRGLDAVIADPCNAQLMAVLTASEALLGHDEYCMSYLDAHRSGQLEPEKPVSVA